MTNQQPRSQQLQCPRSRHVRYKYPGPPYFILLPRTILSCSPSPSPLTPSRKRRQCSNGSLVNRRAVNSERFLFAIMEGSDSGEGSGGSSSKSSNAYAGMKRRHSGKVVKRTVIQPPKQQTPLYNIHKNDFRSIVQRLTGSPSAPPPPPPLQKTRPPPPPLESVYSFNELVSNPANLTAMNSVSFPSYQQEDVAAPTATFAPFTATAGLDSGLQFQFPSPQIYPPLVSHVTVPSAFSAPIQFSYNAAAAAAMAAQPGGSPVFVQSFVGNGNQFVSSGSQFAVSEFVSAGSQVPFSAGSLMQVSPAEQLQFGQLPPPSPASFFSLPATAHLPSSSF